MRVSIIGLGAVGGLLAYMARRVKPSIIYRSLRYREALECLGGVYVRLPDGSREIVEVEHGLTGELEESSFDAVFIGVKAYDTIEAAKEAIRLVKDNGVIIVVQNGVGGLEEVLEMVKSSEKRASVAAGVLTYGVVKVRVGVIEVRGIGELVLGYKKGHGDLEALKRVVGILDANVRVVEDIEPYRWLKVLVNAAINPLTVIANEPNRVVLEVDDYWKIAEMVVEEGKRVIEALGIPLLQDPLEAVKEVAIKTGNNISSMLQDIRMGKPTEIDYINGAIVRMGKEKNIETPVNYILTLLIKGLAELRRT